MQARYRMYEIRSIEIGPRPVTPEVQDHIRCETPRGIMSYVYRLTIHDDDKK